MVDYIAPDVTGRLEKKRENMLERRSGGGYWNRDVNLLYLTVKDWCCGCSFAYWRDHRGIKKSENV